MVVGAIKRFHECEFCLDTTKNILNLLKSKIISNTQLNFYLKIIGI
jgi:hypothetical protein